jgi:hypothetical protein
MNGGSRGAGTSYSYVTNIEPAPTSPLKNARNSFSPTHPWYQQAVDWDEAWLKTHGF